MKKLFMFAALFCACFVAIGQDNAKPGVIGSDVEGNLVRNVVWKKYGKGFDPEFKAGTATFTSDNAKKVQGLRTVVTLNQNEAKPIIISAESKAENVSVKSKNNYSFYLDVTYTDKTRKYGVAVPFNKGTHDWEKAEMTFTPEKPIKTIRAHLLFRYVTGTASFRNALIAEKK